MAVLPRIAIIDENTLEAVGLKTMLDTIVPMVEVSVFSSFEVFQAEILPPPGESKGAIFVHFFVSPRILMANSQFFIERQRQTIVLTSKEVSSPSLGHYITLDTSQSEHDLVKAMLALHKRGHANPDGNGFHHPGLEERNILGAGIPISKREAEVLALVARGFINKEIADSLCISLATVISHRKNICEKLHLHSVSALTIYAVTHGLVRVEEI
ncbi:MAG: helix-turn-helix transcriptional regulator [Bacteroidaceae bacterium]|nr:helix-turn-helix transcriptional regulator [Bacteroidaceae bacterium]